MPITNLSVTDTFRVWFNKTNEVIDKLNTGVVADGATAYGTFILGTNTNTSFSMIGVLVVNSTAVNVAANLAIGANATVGTTARVFNVSSNTFLLQSPGGTIINASPFSVNANALFTGAVSIQNNVTIAGVLNISGNLVISNAEIIAGALNLRQILYGQAGAMLVPSALVSPQYNDFGPTGFDDSSIVNLSPSIDAVITGMLAPSALSVGGHVKYIQNIGTTFKVTLVSQNTASGAFNRFKTPNDAPLDILPGGSIVLIWTTSNKQWRIAGGGPSSSILNVTLQGLTNVAGNLAVTGISSFTGNSTFGATTLFVDTVNNRVGVKHTSPSAPLTVNGNTVLVGTQTITGATSLAGNTVFTGNTTITGILTLSTVGNTAVFGNTIFADSVTQSFVRNFKANTFVSDGVATFANAVATGKATLNGTLVIPVGANKWAV